MTPKNYNRYHPLVILLYHSNMLSPEESKQISSSTRYRWNEFRHHDYFGHEWAAAYVRNFEDIKNVYARKNLYKTVRLLCALSNGYSDIMEGLDSKHKILRKNALNFTNSIKIMSQKTNQPILKIVKLFGVNKDWYYRNRPQKGCAKSPIGKCYQANPFQLTHSEVGDIEKNMTDSINKYKTKTTIYWEMMRKGVLYCSISTFFKYAKLFRGNPKSIKTTNPPKPYRATQPFESLHIDIMHVFTKEDGVQKVAFVKDNYSKALLNKASTDGKAGSEFIRNLLEDTYCSYELYNLNYDINLITDGGPENKGFVLDWIEELDTPPIVRKLTANTDDFPFSNNMSESTHKIFKTEFLHGRMPLNKIEHEKLLDQFYDYYNNHRYPTDHYGFTVIEVLNGAKPDKQKYRNEKKMALQKRYNGNINFEGCPTISGLCF